MIASEAALPTSAHPISSKENLLNQPLIPRHADEGA